VTLCLFTCESKISTDFGCDLDTSARSSRDYSISAGGASALVESLIVFLGIAILGTEFPAAYRLGQWLKRALAKAVSRWKSWRASRAARTSSPSRMDASRS
jgi:hypothetical protein